MRSKASVLRNSPKCARLSHSRITDCGAGFQPAEIQLKDNAGSRSHLEGMQAGCPHHNYSPGGMICRMSDTQTLYHVSDQPGIAIFEPRESRLGQLESLVWAIDLKHLPNYLLPRDCPRVTFAAGPDTSKHDIERFIKPVSASRVIAVESAWLSRISKGRLYVYELSSPHFELQDECAGYYVSPVAVKPNAERCVDNLFEELFRHDIELRVMKSLWDLWDEVIASSLEYSIIRMRNAQPPKRDTLCIFHQGSFQDKHESA